MNENGMNETAIEAIIDEIFDHYQRLGHRRYGEEVTELEHALQAAMLAEQGGENPAMIAACLLHDSGHLLHGEDEEIARAGIDAAHETVGAAYLSRHLPAAVVEPIRWHVAAKRYLCHRLPRYYAGLSAASRLSLQLQGGPMSAASAGAFERIPYYREAIQLRRYDDAAKMANTLTPVLESYRPLLRALIVSNRGDS
jgi:phosphonate degradation associated HDIG domain protein